MKTETELFLMIIYYIFDSLFEVLVFLNILCQTNSNNNLSLKWSRAVKINISHVIYFMYLFSGHYLCLCTRKFIYIVYYIYINTDIYVSVCVCVSVCTFMFLFDFMCVLWAYMTTNLLTQNIPFLYRVIFKVNNV